MTTLAEISMAPIDWVIVALVCGGVLAIGVRTRGYMRSVADFLAAGRGAGRYLICMSYGVANIGAISVLAEFEKGYASGFTLYWWEPLIGLVVVIIMLFGFVFYRFRRTRALTLAEYFERRYGRKFRVYSGLIIFLAGLFNFAIFPIVGARFFVYFCGLPTELHLLGLGVPTVDVLMAVLLTVAVWFVFAGGQVSVAATDFAQGVLVNVSFIVIAAFLLFQVDWSTLGQVALAAPASQSPVNPFDTGEIKNFGFMFFAVSIVAVIYGQGSWQGEQAYLTSARTAHELRMGGVLKIWYLQIRLMFFMVVPVIAYVMLRAPGGWEGVQAAVASGLETIENSKVQDQLRVPLVLTQVLPAGLRGLMASMMLAAFISTHNTYLHSWGSVLVQDVILPIGSSLGRRPGRRAHLWMLRAAILGVAAFTYVYGAFIYKPDQPIRTYMDATGGLFLSWSGAVIIGGLYWKRATPSAAWVTALVGSALSIAVFVARQMVEAVGGVNGVLHDGSGLDRAALIVTDALSDGTQTLGLTMSVCSLTYYLVSKVGQWRGKAAFDLDRMLHKGAHEIKGEVDQAGPTARAESLVGRLLGFSPEHSFGDKVICVASISFAAFWFAVTLSGSVWMLVHLARGGTVQDTTETWIEFWKWRTWLMLAVAAGATVWLGVGGAIDLRRMLRQLAATERDDRDAGIVDSIGDAPQ
ncbi:MAG: hypothetical protein H6810_12695 [Phycisphaeraceae bacterium]|nr:MAG: hypothetical protein H6810_12695 [Phycisphaeraceae bacterium]